MRNKQPFAFAGLWDSWRDFNSGDEIYTFTIITTEANALVRRIHNRMPVIYDPAMGKQWLDHSADSAMYLAAVLDQQNMSGALTMLKIRQFVTT